MIGSANRRFTSLRDRLDERDRGASSLGATVGGRRALRTLRQRRKARLAERLERLEPEERELMSRAADLLERLPEEEAP